MSVAGTQLFPETSAVPGVGLSIGSQRNLSNNFIVDGLSANDDAAALGGMVYGVDAVDQFQVVTSGGQAELGRALGGYVNIVTKSGTNVVAAPMATATSGTTGSTRATRCREQNCRCTRCNSVRARAARSSATARFSSRTSNAKQLDQTGLVTILPDNVSAINARLAASGYRGPL